MRRVVVWLDTLTNRLTYRTGSLKWCVELIDWLTDRQTTEDYCTELLRAADYWRATAQKLETCSLQASHWGAGGGATSLLVLGSSSLHILPGLAVSGSGALTGLSRHSL